MKRAGSVYIYIGLLVLSLAIIGSIGASQSWAADKTYRLKLQSMFPHGDLSMDLTKVFAESAKTRSDGKLKINIFADPDIVPGDQLLVGTAKGVLDMFQGAPNMWAGIIPVANVEFGLPMAFNIPGDASFKEKAQKVREFFFKTGFAEILREEYAKQNLYWLDIHTYGPVPFVLSKQSFKSCDDLKGKKMRAEGMNLLYHGGVGMQGTSISGLETYMALKLGTVDAAEWDVSAVTGLNWHEVAPYWVRGMENDQCIGHILINLDRWNSFPEDIKQALKGAGEDYWNATVDGYEKEMEKVQALVKEGKIFEDNLDPACVEEYSKVAHQLWEKSAKEDPASAKAIELLKVWREENK